MTHKNDTGTNLVSASAPTRKGRKPEKRTGSNGVAASAVKRKVEKRKLSDLKAHPNQHDHFLDLRDGQLDRLAKSLKEHGLKHPVEITTDNVIICGHQRTEAARSNGWEEIDVIVRDDLADDVAIEAELLRDNRERRQLSPLQEARVLKAEWGLFQNLADEDPPEHLQGTLIEVVSRELEMSDKNARRYIQVLTTPDEVQQAFDDGCISLVKAARVAGLSESDQHSIADEIDDEEDPKEVIETYLSKKKQRSRPGIKDLLRSALDCFERGWELLRAREHEVSASDFEGDYVPRIQRYKDMAERILAKVEEASASTSSDDLLE